MVIAALIQQTGGNTGIFLIIIYQPHQVIERRFVGNGRYFSLNVVVREDKSAAADIVRLIVKGRSVLDPRLGSGQLVDQY